VDNSCTVRYSMLMLLRNVDLASRIKKSLSSKRYIVMQLEFLIRNASVHVHCNHGNGECSLAGP